MAISTCKPPSDLFKRKTPALSSGFFILKMSNPRLQLAPSKLLSANIQAKPRLEKFKPANGHEKRQSDGKPLPIDHRMHTAKFHCEQKDAQKDKNHAVSHDKQLCCLPK
ncbi:MULTISPECIES: hypothetical protein [unclassified Limnobacter]|jgi:hypothetical protein|uniref:hypothetical protein n=1 Tax=unclassified Limnobacter TaxID=2630203 RepID=UPI0025BE38E1|nr:MULTISPECIES: hypothetical protein [unclassified Limnobacter]|tara:strand:- start:6452 stop:6778 length:327 start_codon:yes stop_codon:yes gene_type:complete